ncbi:hypothetical protein ACUZXZ_08360 [Pseudomonas juntendi]|uniref:hypothetical protein n=1 Tax=Pseudomonas juntendi TaxID=2666183 RepID=UPI001F486916|nr:hypothetical protein [Pseudomonas juntendi]MCO7057164.1 hypothetical protein [Pseudomonas juntendi]UJM14049.1 hypothetical protein L1P09_07645 [Pseudomonas juntendi]
MKKLTILASLLLVGCGESDHVSFIKKQVLSEIDPSRTLGNALENRDRCTSYKWSESTDSAGRNVVTYVCKMDAGVSDAILQKGFDKIIDDAKSEIKEYKRKVSFADNFQPCIHKDADQYYEKACENVKNGYLKSASLLESRIPEIEDFKDNEISEVQQIIDWSVIDNTPPSAVMLSAKYVITMDDGQTFEFKQGRETLHDVYNNNERLNPVQNLHRMIAPPVCLNCN